MSSAIPKKNGKLVFIDMVAELGEQKMAEPAGATDFSQGIYPLVAKCI